MLTQRPIEIWGGIEATINRVNDEYLDQSEYSGHYNRKDDIDLIASLGIKMLRYPVLWEKHQPEKDTIIDWTFVEKNLLRLKELNVEPIAGLVHHGSGPKFVNFFDGSFEKGVADYARLVALKFPWLEYYTPVNEPLTTARFCGLYGHWYPHESNDYCFYRILLSECKATVMAMETIREINPDAKLIQTEDLGKVYSTPFLKYQADFENERRWLSYELITGTFTPEKPMWGFLTGLGIKEDELNYFLNHNCKPHIAGFNYYITSERYLDEDLQKYPQHVHGGNGRHQYADVEVVRVPYQHETGPAVLIREAWKRLQLPIAVTECHLHCTREEQMRWFNEMWVAVNELKAEGVDVRALTAWAIFGTHGWNSLVTKPWGVYESGVFNLRSGSPRPTAIAKLIQELSKNNTYQHPVLKTEGWWKQEKRIAYPDHRVFNIKKPKTAVQCQPVLILGKSTMLGSGFMHVCAERNINCALLNQNEDLSNPETIEQLVKELKPWAIILTEEYANIDQAEQNQEACFKLNCEVPLLLAEVCKKHSVKLLTFSSGFVFDGKKDLPYTESDRAVPINVYGKSKAKAEAIMLEHHPQTLIIRTGICFSPWDHNSFAGATVIRFKERRTVTVANDVFISLTYVPDLVHESLNLLLDDESGIFHVANQGQTSYAGFARKIALMAGYNPALVKGVATVQLQQKASRPHNISLQSEKGIQLPAFESAIEHYLDNIDYSYLPERMAV